MEGAPQPLTPQAFRQKPRPPKRGFFINKESGELKVRDFKC